MAVSMHFNLLPHARIGLGTSHDEVRGILVSRGRIVRRARAIVNEEKPLEVAVAGLLARLQRGRWTKPPVMAALGPGCSQMRRLSRLPSVPNDRVLADIVRSNAGRFFIKNGIPLLTSGVRRGASGDAWAAAFEEPTVRAIVSACRTNRLTLGMAVPAPLALWRASRSRTVVSTDGDSRIVTEWDRDGSLVSVGRAASPEQLKGNPTFEFSCELRTLGADASSYADAFGATLIERSERLALRARDLGSWRSEPVPRWRVVAAAVALVLALAFALLAPVVAAKQASRGAATRLASVNKRLREATWTQRELARVTASLDSLSAFARARFSVTEVLEELTAALPVEASLASIQLDKAGGTIVVIAARVAMLLPELREVPSISNPTIVGAITPEGVGATRAERATIRFTWKRRASALRVPGDTGTVRK